MQIQKHAKHGNTSNTRACQARKHTSIPNTQTCHARNLADSNLGQWNEENEKEQKHQI